MTGTAMSVDAIRDALEAARLVSQWHGAIGSGPIEVLDAELGELREKVLTALAALDPAEPPVPCNTCGTGYPNPGYVCGTCGRTLIAHSPGETGLRDALRKMIESGSLFDVVYVTRDGAPEKALLVEDIERLLSTHAASNGFTTRRLRTALSKEERA